MKCTKCGADFKDGTLFCPICGEEVQWVPEYSTMETLLRQKEIEEQERKKRELEAKKERERIQKKLEQEKKRKRRERRILATTITAVIAAGAAAMFFLYRTQTNSFDFQMAQAETKFSNKSYEEALEYVEHALELSPASAEANILQAKIYLKQENENMALSILLSVVQSNPDSTSAYGELLRLYEKQGAYEEIKDLMDQASDKIRTSYADYVCNAPSVSKSGGNYTEEVAIDFVDVEAGTEIYYTLDGSEPNQKSTKYEETILLEEEGDTELKFLAYNEKAIPSDVITETYKIKFEAPERPQISPGSDRYEYSAEIVVTAEEGCAIYYAFDEEPTIESEKYTGPIQMPTGEHTFSAIAVDARGKVSNVASAIYVYYG